jgi:hypothetical protein
LQNGNSSYFPHQASMLGNTMCIAGNKSGTSWVLIGQRQ